MDLGLATRRRAEVLRREIYDLTQAMVKLNELRRPEVNVFPCGCVLPFLVLDTCGIHGLQMYRRIDEQGR